MKTYRDLKISASTDEQLAATVTEIESSLDNGWSRSRPLEAEKHAQNGSLSDKSWLCFACDSTASRKAANLFFRDRGHNLDLINILPAEFGQLTHDEYNVILEEFLHRFVRAAAAKTGSTISTSSGAISIDDWFSPGTAEKLRRFLKLTRGYIGHRADDDLWKAFLIAAHQERSPVHGDMLRQWLVEDGGCEMYAADKLAAEYQFSQDLLERVGA